MVLGRVMFRYSRYRRCNVRNRKVSDLDHLALRRHGPRRTGNASGIYVLLKDETVSVRSERWHVAVWCY